APPPSPGLRPATPGGDRRRGPPPPRPEGELADGGRGLLLVERLADRWGWYPRVGAPGKTVWAECALP
ncbi:ATP-binding protein, partial [Streptomyces sp. NPDC059082]|uniref:ATP-binding protein n=1 Tax=Streptomyces sp. NPDC059082 TaxID=3346720 RepID=UPI0036A10815